MTNLTRRQLGLLAASSLAVAQAPPDWFAQAVESKRADAEDLAKFEIGIAVEPAFQFKA